MRDRRKGKRACKLVEAASTFFLILFERDDMIQEVHAQRTRSSILIVKDIIANFFDTTLATWSMNMESWDETVRSRDRER